MARLLAVGITDIARRAGVRPDTVKKWIDRHTDFPAPTGTAARGRLFHWPAVHKWLVSTGRGDLVLDALLALLAKDDLMVIPMAGEPVVLVIVSHPESWTWSRARRHIASRARQAGLTVTVADHNGLPGQP